MNTSYWVNSETFGTKNGLFSFANPKNCHSSAQENRQSDNRVEDKSVKKLISDLEMQPFVLLFGVTFVLCSVLQGRILGPSINDINNWYGGGVKNWSKLPKEGTEKLPKWGRGCQKSG
jgi:hypothetical protein